MGEPADWSNRFFVDMAKTFEETYPELEDALVEWKESGNNTDRPDFLSKNKDQKFNSRFSIKENHGTLISCSNTLCKKGGFQLGFVIHEMIRKKETEREGFIPCEGYEPMGRGNKRRCLNSISYRITLKYKR